MEKSNIEMYYFLVHLIWSLVKRQFNTRQRLNGLPIPAVTGMLEMLTATTVAAIRDSNVDFWILCLSRFWTNENSKLIKIVQRLLHKPFSCTSQRDSSPSPSCSSMSLVVRMIPLTLCRLLWLLSVKGDILWCFPNK